MPMPVSHTASSIQLPPLGILRAVSLTSPLLGEFARIAQEIEQNLPQPHWIDHDCAQVFLRLDQESIAILLRELAGGTLWLPTIRSAPPSFR
jgi:hypothetical protein